MVRWIKRLLDGEPEDDAGVRRLACGLRDAMLERLGAAQTLLAAAVAGHVQGLKEADAVEEAQARLCRALSSYVRMETLCARPVLRLEDLPSNTKDV